MKYIERAMSTVLSSRVKTSKCILVTRARQVGKSTLIKHDFPEYNRANFDDRLTRPQAKEEPKLFFLNNPCLLFIDEVQKENSILEEIKIIADETDERGVFILSGSQKLELMKGMSESLAGRVSIAELSGLSLREIHKIKFNKHFVPTKEYISTRNLKSYMNEGKDYKFNIFYYRGKDRSASGENEINLIIEEDGILYPVEIKMSGNPKASMAQANTVLDKVKEKRRGMGVILCLVDKKTYLKDNLLALPIEYI